MKHDGWTAARRWQSHSSFAPAGWPPSYWPIGPITLLAMPARPREKEIENRRLSMPALSLSSWMNLSQESGSPPAQAVRRFLENGAMRDLPADLEARDLVTFQVDGKLLVDEPEVRKYWAAREDARNASGAQGALPCLRPGLRHRKSPPSPHQTRPRRADLGLRPGFGQCARL